MFGSHTALHTGCEDAQPVDLPTCPFFLRRRAYSGHEQCNQQTIIERAHWIRATAGNRQRPHTDMASNYRRRPGSRHTAPRTRQAPLRALLAPRDRRSRPRSRRTAGAVRSRPGRRPPAAGAAAAAGAPPGPAAGRHGRGQSHTRDNGADIINAFDKDNYAISDWRKLEDGLKCHSAEKDTEKRPFDRSGRKEGSQSLRTK